jgi:TP901 family phage tail tape measure protein
MPQNVGTVSTTLQLDTRQAVQQYNRFQQTIQRGASGRNSMFGAISADARDFDNSLGKATNRVVAFGVAAAVFTGVAKATRAFAESIVEVDKNLAAINVNLGQSAQGLKQFGSDLFNVARQTGTTFEAASGAAAELARQGLSAEETIKRLKDALILSRIAGLGSAESVEALTAAINSFNQEALTSSEIVNKFAAVDTKFAVSSKDLAEAISRVGSTAQSAGVGIDQLIGLVTSLQQTTARGGATIGNGLKTIFTRIQAAPETVSALESVGVAIKNTDGSLRDAISILRDYASARERVGEAERAALDRTVAGTFQVNILKAALGDLSKQYSVYGNAVNTASNATDEAIRKNEQLNQTIASLLNSTGLSIKQLFASIGDQKITGLFGEILKEVEQLRAYLSGDAGDELGASLGNGLIKGLSNVLSGPGLIAVAVILINAFKKVILTIAQEARTLLTINSAALARANIQKQIVQLLQQATEAEKLQLAAATSVLARKEQILAIQARINQEELAGNPLTRSFQVAGPLGVGSRTDPRIKRGGGYIGNFADPIGAAINREKAAGVNPKDIYVDRDPRVANFANPLGLLVANRRDEPLGGYQGVNRVISQGGNPKTAGMSAPNFAAGPRDPTIGVRNAAADEIYSLFRALKGVKPLSEEFNKIGSQIQDASLKLSKASRENVLGRLAQQFNQAFISAKIVTGEVSSSGYVTPTGGGFDRSGTFGNAARKNSLPNQGILGPAFPINPQLQKRLAIQAEIDAQQRLEDRFRASQERRRVSAANIVQSRQTQQNRALGLAFLAPFASGFVPDAPGGTLAGQASGALQGAGQGAGLGIFGPQAAVVGVALGALVGYVSKSNQSLAEFNEAIDKTVAAQNAGLDAARKVATLNESIAEGGGSGAAAVRLRQQKAEALLNVDPEFRGRLGASNISQTEISQILEEISDKVSRASIVGEVQKGGNALSRGGLLDQAKRFAGNGVAAGPLRGLSFFASQFDNPFEGVNQARDIGKDLSGLVNSRNSGSIDESLLNRVIGGKSQSGDVEKLSAIYDKLGATTEITADKQVEFAEALKTAKTRFDRYSAIIADLEKSALKGRLSNTAFTNSPNLGVYQNAALTGRSPRSSQASRAQADFAFFQELISSGVASEKGLESNADFRKARAGTQQDNALRAALSLLKGNNPSITGLTNNLGDPNALAIERQLQFLAGAGVRNSGKAGLALDFVQRARNTAGDAGINSLSYGPNFDSSQSGLAPGGKYSVTAGDALKAAQATVEKTLQSVNGTVIRTALQVDGTIKVMSDTKSSTELQQLAAELTAAIGKQFQAQITDLNLRLSKVDGQPPPTPVSTNSAFGNNLTKGSDGFIRKTP